MSARIEQILAVLSEVRNSGARSFAGIRDARIEASKEVARRRCIRERSVSDKYLRQLEPEVNGTWDFDVLVEAWLTKGGTKLKEVLLLHVEKRSVDEARADEIRINGFFSG